MIKKNIGVKHVMFIMSGLAPILNKKLSYTWKQKSQSSGDYPVFDRKSDGIVVIG
jgi:hypothetical protein